MIGIAVVQKLSLENAQRSQTMFQVRESLLRADALVEALISSWKRRLRSNTIRPLDLADSGHTLHKVVDLLRNNYKPITELRSAVIWTKGLSTFTPDYSVEYLPTNPWIHQPFEGYDSLTPQKLLEKWKV